MAARAATTGNHRQPPATTGNHRQRLGSGHATLGLRRREPLTSARATSLDNLIRDEIARGPVTFARFMALALYHPTLGYYSGGGQGREPIGWQGDFFTSGDLHPLWGWSIARQLHQMWELLGRPERFDVLEPGAGRGLLAADIWRFARDHAPDWLPTLRYALVDRSPPDAPLRRARAQRLADELAALDVPAGATRWLGSAGAAFPARGLTGVVISNELVDALPVHLLQLQGGALREVYVAVDGDGALVEVLGDPSAPALQEYLDGFGIPWRSYPDGWRCEVCLDAISWMRDAARTLRRGFILTIDYGDTARNLYVRDRFRGTLAGYRRHQLVENPLALPGRQDLTAHVNFSALIEACRAEGVRLAGLTTHRDFLLRLGIREEAESLARRLYPAADAERHTDRGQADLMRRRSLQNAVAVLLDPRGLGGFRVLVQHRGVPGARDALLGLAGPAAAAPQ